jgi:RNA polymerase sigma factor (sigma-70 family)
MDLHEQQTAAWRRWKAGERDAAGRLFVKWYDNLIGSTARKYSLMSRNDGFEDFVQIGREALTFALDTYDPGRSRLPWHIQRMVWQAASYRLTKQNGAFSIPSSRREKEIQRGFSRDSRELQEAGVSWADIREVLAAKYRIQPVDVDALYAMRHGRVNTEDDSTEQAGSGPHQLASDDAPSEEAITQARAGETIEALFQSAGLNERERVCVLARYKDGEEVAYETLGAQFGVSRERARQYVNQGLEKLHRAAKKQGLAFEDLW